MIGHDDAERLRAREHRQRGHSDRGCGPSCPQRSGRRERDRHAGVRGRAVHPDRVHALGQRRDQPQAVTPAATWVEVVREASPLVLARDLNAVGRHRAHGEPNPAPPILEGVGHQLGRDQAQEGELIGRQPQQGRGHVQLRGLSHSPIAQHYGITGKEEARAYFADPVLGFRLVECTALVNHVGGKTAHGIFGSPDDMKFRSCVTLFATIQPQPFEDALRKYYGAKSDPMTIELLHAA